MFEKLVKKYRATKTLEYVCTAKIDDTNTKYKKKYKYIINFESIAYGYRRNNTDLDFNIVYYSNVYNESFMNSLTKFLEQFMNDKDNNYLKCFNVLRSSNNKEIEKFFNQHANDDYTEDLILELLIKSCVNYSPNKLSDTEVKNYIKEYKKKYQAQRPDIEYINNNKPEYVSNVFLPQYVDLQAKEVDIVALATYYLTMKTYSIENVKNFIKFKNIIDDKLIEDDTSIVDCVVNNNVKNNVKQPFYLPLYSKNVVEFLQTLTVGEVRELNKSIIKYNSVTDFINLAKTWLNDAMTLEELTKVYLSVIQRSDNDVSQGTLMEFYNFLVYTNSIAQMIVVDRLNKFDKELTKEDIKKLSVDFLRITNKKDAANDKKNYALQKLWEVTDHDSEFIFNLINEINVNNYTVSFTQWKNYCKNFEDYKDMPISWWIKLV